MQPCDFVSGGRVTKLGTAWGPAPCLHPLLLAPTPARVRPGLVTTWTLQISVPQNVLGTLALLPAPLHLSWLPAF